MELPSHPEADDTSADQPRATVRWATWLLLAVVVALVTVMLVLHLTGVVGPGAD